MEESANHTIICSRVERLSICLSRPTWVDPNELPRPPVIGAYHHYPGEVPESTAVGYPSGEAEPASQKAVLSSISSAVSRHAPFNFTGYLRSRAYALRSRALLVTAEQPSAPFIWSPFLLESIEEIVVSSVYDRNGKRYVMHSPLSY